MGALDTLQPLTNQDAAAPPVGANTTTPDGAPPSWSTATAASFRSAIDTTPFVQDTRLRDAYAGLTSQVAQFANKTEWDYELPIWKQAANALNPWGQSDPIDHDALWADIAKMQAAGYPIKGITNRQDFESHVLTRDGAHQADAAIAGQGSWTANLAGGLAAMPASPANMAAAVIGGPELPEVAQAVLGKTLSGMASSGLTNAAVTGALEPSTIAAKARLGEATSAQDVAGDIGTALVFGAGMHVAGMALAPIVKPIAGVVRDAAGNIAQRFSDAVPPIYRAPEEQAAVNVLDRNGEVEGSNPFPNSTAAMDLHKQRLSEATADLDAGRMPGASPGFAPVAREAVQASGGGLDPEIVQFFQTKGLSQGQARGIAAGIEAESRSNPTASNPKSGALGIGQWLGDRKQGIIDRYGEAPTKAQQLEYLWGELNGGDKGGAAVLAQGDEGAVMDAYIRRFMRPKAGPETAGDLARGMSALGRHGEIPQFADLPNEIGGPDNSIEVDELQRQFEEARAETPDTDQTPEAPVEHVGDTSAVGQGDIGAPVATAAPAGAAAASEAQQPLSVQVLMPGLRAAIRDPSVKMNDIAGLANALDAHPDDVRAGLQQMVAAGALAQRSDNGAFMRAPPGRDMSLIESIQKGGGIWDGGDPGSSFKGGDFAAMGLDDWYKGGRFRSKAPIIRSAEMGHGDRGADKVLRQAIEEGYFPELRAAHDAAGPSTLDVNDLHHAIAEELAGRPRYPVGSRSYERLNQGKADPRFEVQPGEVPVTRPASSADFAIRHLPEQLHEEMSLAATWYGRALDTFDPWIIDHAHNLATRHGIDGGEALDRAVNDYARINADEALAETGNNDYGKIDYDTDPFTWPDGPADRREGGAAAPDRGGQEPAGGAAAPGEPRGGIAGSAGDGERDARIAAGLEPPPHVDSAALQRFDDPDGDGVKAVADSAWHDVMADAGVKDPAIAAREAERAKLGAEAPLRGENKTGQAQDGTMGLGLFDTADSREFDLGDGRGPRSVADIAAEFADDQGALDAIEGCLK